MKNSISILFLLTSLLLSAQNYPKKNWSQYQYVEEAGFSKEKLDDIEKMHKNLKGETLLVIYDGSIVLSIGDPSRKLMDHSMRKSYVSALYGIYTEKGAINLNETLEEIGIDDLQSLSPEEKKATVEDLLSARSGVYHPAAYSPRGMSERLPERGSHLHGTFWYYNNWDFNTLSTIFKIKTGLDLFEAFQKEISNPIGMEDFELKDTFYRYEDLSKHPAYLFRLSARDEARFGLLYMNNGKWKNRQIIPKQWIDKSTSSITSALTNFDNRDGYGYLWWTTTISTTKGYYASGVGGQRIAIFPSRKLVIIQSTDTYDGSRRIADAKIDELMAMILDAQTGEAKLKPTRTTPQINTYDYPAFSIDNSIAKVYIGDYHHQFLGTMSLSFEKGKWMLTANVGSFELHPASNTKFIPEDIRFPLIMEKATISEEKGLIKPTQNQDGSLAYITFYY